MNIPENKKEMVLDGMVKALFQDNLSFWDLLYFNNPVSLVAALRKAGTTDRTMATDANIVPALQRLIAGRDTAKMANVVSDFEFKSDTDNFTTYAPLWDRLGVKLGDVNSLFQKIYNQ